MNLAARAARLSMWIWDVPRDKVRAAPHASQQRQPASSRSHSRTSSKARIRRIANISSEPCSRAVATGEEVDVEYRVVGADGDVRWIAARGRAEKGDGAAHARRRDRHHGAQACRAAGRRGPHRAAAHDPRVDAGAAFRVDRAPVEPAARRDSRQRRGGAENAQPRAGRSRRAARDLRRHRGGGQPGGGGHSPSRRAVQARRHEDGAARSQRADSRNARSVAHRAADPPCHAAHRSGAGAAARSKAGACNCSRSCSISSSTPPTR